MAQMFPQFLPCEICCVVPTRCTVLIPSLMPTSHWTLLSVGVVSLAYELHLLSYSLNTDITPTVVCVYILLTLACACAAKGYCSRSVSLCVGLFPRFLSNRGCCRYQTWICGYVQRALGTARVWSGVVQEQLVYSGSLKLYTVIILSVH